MAIDYASLSDELSELEVRDICREVADNRCEGVGLSEYATQNSKAFRRGRFVYGVEDGGEQNSPFSTVHDAPFHSDAMAVCFSKEFQRLGGKTQSLSRPVDDHITNRLIHTSRVAEISAYIARSLAANVDLAQAIARGHDIGHAPFGHLGEAYITRALYDFRSDLIGALGCFKHNIQSVHVVDRIATRRGSHRGGLELTDQVRHGIISHDGEVDQTKSVPNRELGPENLASDIQYYIKRIIKASAEIEFDAEIEDDETLVREHRNVVCPALKKVSITPATLEACIVFMADVLTYCPDDFEDMKKLGLAKRETLPIEIIKTLGASGEEILRTLLDDLIIHSYGKDGVFYSEKVGKALQSFKRDVLYPCYYQVNRWIYSMADNVYMRPVNRSFGIRQRMNYLFKKYSDALEKPASSSSNSIIKGFFSDRDLTSYFRSMPDDKNCNVRAMIDYIAGFTDDMFFRESEGLSC